MTDEIQPQGNRDMRWGIKRTVIKPELTAQEKADAAAKQALLDIVTSIYEEGCFADDNQPNFYYREYEDAGLLAVYRAGIEAGRKERE